VRYVRGFVGIASYTMGSYLKWMKKLCAAAPLESIVICDRVLNRELPPYGKVGYFYVPFALDAYAGEMTEFPYPSCVVPEFLFDLATLLRDKDAADHVTDCYKWLNWGALFLSRRLAGLPDVSFRPEGATTFNPLRAGLPERWFDRNGTPHSFTLAALENDSELQQRIRDRDPLLVNYKRLHAYYLDDVFGTRTPTDDDDFLQPSPAAPGAIPFGGGPVPTGGSN
jgi:hypothetical protein